MTVREERSDPPGTAGEERAARPFPLAMATEGDEVRIVGLRGGRGLDKRLTGIGLNVDSVLRIIQRRPGGALIVARGETRVALGGGMSQKIMVVLG